MELVQKQIHTNRVGKSIFDQFFIDDDYNVPDLKGDIARVVLSKGNIKIEEIKRMENYIRVSGKLYFQVLYVTADAEAALTVLEGKRPFEEMVYADDGGEEVYHIRNTRIEFDANVIHSGKLSVKAMVELEIGAEQLEDVTITTDIESEEQLYKKEAAGTDVADEYEQAGYLSD